MKTWQKIVICVIGFALLFTGMGYRYYKYYNKKQQQENYRKVVNPDYEYGDTYVIDVDDAAEGIKGEN